MSNMFSDISEIGLLHATKKSYTRKQPFNRNVQNAYFKAKFLEIDSRISAGVL